MRAGGGETYEPEAAINAFLAQHPNSPVTDVPRACRLRRRQCPATTRRLEERRRAHDRRSSAISTRRSHAMSCAPLCSRRWRTTGSMRLFYATYDHAPAIVPNSTPGTNRRLAASLSFPAISVPGGFFADGLPIGLEFLARPFAEGTLHQGRFRLRASNEEPQAAVHGPRPAF